MTDSGALPRPSGPRRGWSLRDRKGIRHAPMRANDEDAYWTPIACGEGIVLPGSQRREPVDCPECIRVRREAPHVAS